MLAVALLLSTPAASADSRSTLTLDGLSYLTFDGGRTFQIPSGSTMGFLFDEPSGDGSLSFTLEPDSVVIGPIEAAQGVTLRYSLDRPARGTMRIVDGERQIDFTAVLRATLESPDGISESTYSISFTTGSATATDVAGKRVTTVEGMRLVDGPNYVQLVTATTNRADAAIEPGSATHGVLSGSFDSLPSVKR